MSNVSSFIASLKYSAPFFCATCGERNPSVFTCSALACFKRGPLFSNAVGKRQIVIVIYGLPTAVDDSQGSGAQHDSSILASWICAVYRFVEHVSVEVRITSRE